MIHAAIRLRGEEPGTPLPSSSPTSRCSRCVRVRAVLSKADAMLVDLQAALREESKAEPARLARLLEYAATVGAETLDAVRAVLEEEERPSGHRI